MKLKRFIAKGDFMKKTEVNKNSKQLFNGQCLSQYKIRS